MLPTLLEACMNLSWVAPGLTHRVSLVVSSVLSTLIRVDTAACEAVDESVHVLAEVESALLTHCPIEAEACREAARVKRELAKAEAARRLSVN